MVAILSEQWNPRRLSIQRLMEDEGTLESHGASPVTDDRMIYDELIAPFEAMMMHSIWRIVRKADLAEDCLQDAWLPFGKTFPDSPAPQSAGFNPEDLFERSL
jgi:hypothetical protein